MSVDFSEINLPGNNPGTSDQVLNCSLQELALIAADILQSGSDIRFRAHGLSMFPLINNGEVIQVAAAKNQELRAGDILLTFDGIDSVKVHRLLGKIKLPGSIRFITRGDNSLTADESIPPEDVLGVVTGVDKGSRQIELRRRGGFRVAGRVLATIQMADWRLGRDDKSGSTVTGKDFDTKTKMSQRLLRFSARIPRKYMRRKISREFTAVEDPGGKTRSTGAIDDYDDRQHP
jgi:signal peptidase I